MADVILNGLRLSICLHVLQKGGDMLHDLIKTAKLADVVAPASNDTTNALVLNYIQSSVGLPANKKQSNEMKETDG